MSAIVRRAGRRDLDQVHALWLELCEQRAKLDPRLAPAEDTAPAAREHLEVVLADKRTALFVAEEQNVVVGYLHVQLEQNERGFQPERYGTLVDLYVAADRRREGLARRLLDTAREWLSSAGAEELRATTSVHDSAAESFLRAAGASPFTQTFRL